MKKITRYPDGGKIDGDTHAQNGVDVINNADDSETQLEGGERVFSVEDTADIDRLSANISSSEGEDSNELAMQLGYKVSKMVAAQDQRQEVPTDDEFLVDGGDEPFDEPTEFIE